MARQYADRKEAGEILAKRLEEYKGRNDVAVLGLARGGLPVAYEVAVRLRAELDVFLVRKIGAPHQPELALGAIATGGAVVMNEAILDSMGVSEGMLKSHIENEQKALKQREQAYHEDIPPVNIEGKTVIVVDDGLATGASMKVAVEAVRGRNPRSVVVAVPVAPPETCGQLDKKADKVICDQKPFVFSAVGRWYVNFGQTSDEEVKELLQSARNGK